MKVKHFSKTIYIKDQYVKKNIEMKVKHFDIYFRKKAKYMNQTIKKKLRWVFEKT